MVIAKCAHVANNQRKVRLMAEHRSTKPPHRKDENESSSPPENAKEKNQSSDISAITDDMLNDIDRMLEEVLDFDDNQVVTDKERDERAERFLRDFVQKGGE
jgi:hypothetical protein